MKRDEQNNIYFAINNETSYKLAYDNIDGAFRIVLGFSVSANGDKYKTIRNAGNVTGDVKYNKEELEMVTLPF